MQEIRKIGGAWRKPPSTAAGGPCYRSVRGPGQITNTIRIMTYTNTNELPLRRDTFRRAWRKFAAEESFAGMTLEEFEAATSPAVKSRDDIADLRAQLAGELRQRRAMDADLRSKLALVVNAVRGNQAHGEDSPLYRAFGYVPKSERSSGLTRKGTPAPPTEPAEAPAAEADAA